MSFTIYDNSDLKLKNYQDNIKRQILITEFGSLNPLEVIEEVKKLQNVAYQLGLEEAKEMTRGKYLHILNKKKNNLNSSDNNSNNFTSMNTNQNNNNISSIFPDNGTNNFTPF